MKIKIPEKIYCCLTMINPNWNIKLRYFMIYKKRFPKNPKTFVEKLLYLRMKYYNKSSLVAQCSDKVEVRNFLVEKGFGNFLNEIYGIYNTAEEFFDTDLPDSFALKWNFGSGFNIICNDKSKLDIEKAKIKMKKWGKKNYYLANAEMQYAKCKKKILAEKYLNTVDGLLPRDYKIYCFDGKAKAILVMVNRDTLLKAGFYSKEWKYLGAEKKYVPLENAEKPVSLEKMINCAEALSVGIPFVRIDFYQINESPIFGEMTFSPAAGFYTSSTLIEGHSMADYINLDKEYLM